VNWKRRRLSTTYIQEWILKKEIRRASSEGLTKVMQDRRAGKSRDQLWLNRVKTAAASTSAAADVNVRSSSFTPNFSVKKASG
jgi:hypothetical protein